MTSASPRNLNYNRALRSRSIIAWAHHRAHPGTHPWAHHHLFGSHLRVHHLHAAWSGLRTCSEVQALCILRNGATEAQPRADGGHDGVLVLPAKLRVEVGAGVGEAKR